MCKLPFIEIRAKMLKSSENLQILKKMVIFEFPTIKIVYILVTEHLQKYSFNYFIGFSKYFDSFHFSCVLHAENVILSQKYLFLKDL